MFRIMYPGLLLTIAIACGGQQSQRSLDDTSACSDLIVVEGATDGSAPQNPAGKAIRYKIHEPYPGETTLKRLNRSLEVAGWRPLKEDVWNPGLPTAHTRGWQDYIDARKPPKFRVYSWNGQWRNRRGDLAVYTLKYFGKDADKGSEPQVPGELDGLCQTAEMLRGTRVMLPPF